MGWVAQWSFQHSIGSLAKLERIRNQPDQARSKILSSFLRLVDRYAGAFSGGVCGLMVWTDGCACGEGEGWAAATGSGSGGSG